MKISYTIKPYITSLDNINICRPEDRLGSALASSRSSHDVVFVYGKNNQFLGLISPYYTLFYRRYPYLSEVKHSLIKPPKMTDFTPLYRAAEFMIAHRIYTLPVFDGSDKVVAKITADTILDAAAENDYFLDLISGLVKINNPITAKIDSTVKEVYKLMRSNNISRVVLVDAKNKLAGIVSRHDIEDAFIAQTPRQRFNPKKPPPLNFSFDEEEIKRQDSPIAEFVTLRVLSEKNSSGFKKIVKKMIGSGLHSIVIVNESGIPSGFLSRHDLLKAISKLNIPEEIPITYQCPKDEFSEYHIKEALQMLEKFTKKFNKKYPIRSVEIHFNTQKNRVGKTNFYNTTLHVLLKSGKLLVTTSHRHRFAVSVKEAIREINNQIDLTDRQKHEM
jgi:CBS domain-containing protein